MAQSAHGPESGRSRARPVRPGRLPVSEFAFDRAGAGSPFGDDVTFPVPADGLTYQHPEPAGRAAEPFDGGRAGEPAGVARHAGEPTAAMP